MRLMIGSTILASAAVLLLTSAAHAADGHHALFLTVTEGESPGHGRTAMLACEPPHGTHPDAKGACRALADVGGDPAAFQDRPVRENVACTLQYQPITVTANGMWGGNQIEFTKTYGNPCALHAETGPVFGLSRDG